MNPIAMLVLGASYGYLAGNPMARKSLIKQFIKLSGMAVDGLNKQGEKNVQATNAPMEQPKLSKD